MIDFIELKIIFYIYKRHTDYSFSDICQLLGLTSEMLEKSLIKLIENEYLQYQGGLLVLTPKAKTELDLETCKSDSAVYNEVMTDKIHPDKAWSLDKPYIPNDF